MSMIFQWYFNDIHPSTPKILSSCKFFCCMTGMTIHAGPQVLNEFSSPAAASGYIVPSRLLSASTSQEDKIPIARPHCFSWVCLMSLKGITVIWQIFTALWVYHSYIVSHPNFEHRALILWLSTSINHGTASLAGFGHLGGSRQRAGWWKWWFEIGGETPSKVNITSSQLFVVLFGPSHFSTFSIRELCPEVTLSESFWPIGMSKGRWIPPSCRSRWWEECKATNFQGRPLVLHLRTQNIMTLQFPCVNMGQNMFILWYIMFIPLWKE